MTLLLPVVPGLPCDALIPRCSLGVGSFSVTLSADPLVFGLAPSIPVAPCSLEFVILPLVDERNIPGVFGRNIPPPPAAPPLCNDSLVLRSRISPVDGLIMLPRLPKVPLVPGRLIDDIAVDGRDSPP